jgi:transcription termination factor Rho
VSDTTDLMGARVEETAAAPATDASAPATGAGSRRRRGTGLEGMVLAELQQVASGLGIRGTARMRKSQLIEVIKEAQAGGASQAVSGNGGGGAPAKAETATETKPRRRATSRTRTGDEAAVEKKADQPAEQAVATQQQIEIPGQPASEDVPAERRRRATAEAGAPASSAETVAAEAKSEPQSESRAETSAQPQQQDQHSQQQGEAARGDAGDNGEGRRRDRDRSRDRGRDRDRHGKGGDQQNQNGQQRQQQNQQQGGGGRQDRHHQDDDDFDGGRRGRRGRYRDRRGRSGRDDVSEPQIAEDDVLIPVAGILDILDNYAFIRTSGYLPGPNDVYVSLAQVRKNGLRKGDHVTGAVRQPKEGERREKFNALVRLDSVNGMAPEHGRGRPEFN